MGRSKELLPASEIIRDSIPARESNVRLRVPSDKHILVHQVLHAQLNDSYWKAIWPSLREAFDSWLLIKRLSRSGELRDVIDEFQRRSGSRLLQLHFLTINDILATASQPQDFDFSSAVSLQWLHRRLLRAAPGLRFLDLYFLARSGLAPRLYRLKDLIRSKDGISYVLKALVRPDFYRNLWSELF